MPRVTPLQYVHAVVGLDRVATWDTVSQVCTWSTLFILSNTSFVWSIFFISFTKKMIVESKLSGICIIVTNMFVTMYVLVQPVQ